MARPVARTIEEATIVPGPTARAVVLSDTHVAVGRRFVLPNALYEHLDGASVILHAGDVTEQQVLDELSGFAPVVAVLGNNDHTLVGTLPETERVELAGVSVAMVHDSGATVGRASRMHKWFPHADVVVFGHSHLPVVEPGVSGQLLFNPGSPTWKRQAPTHTIGVLEVDGGQVTRAEIVTVAR